MEVRKGYKQTEIGVLPIDWEINELDDISIVIDSLHQTPNFSEAGFAMVRVTDIKEGHLNLEKSLRVDESVYNLFIKNHKPKQGNIVMSRVGSYGISSYVQTKEPFCMGQNTVVIEPLINNIYLYFILNSPFIKQQVELESFGTGYKSLSLKNIKELLIPLPSSEIEQTAIASALSDADNYISSLEKLIAKKRLIKHGSMQQLLKPKEGWVMKKLGEIGETIIGLTYKPENVKSDGILVLRSSNIQDGSLEFEDNVFVDIEVADKLILKKNDILVCVRNGSRDLIGKCALISGSAIGQTFGAFMSIFRSPYNEFIVHLFKSDTIKKQIDEYLGATINQITNKSLNSFEIPFPSHADQAEIAKILNEMDSEIETLEKQLSKAQNIKHGMMQQLLTGKIRLL